MNPLHSHSTLPSLVRTALVAGAFATAAARLGAQATPPAGVFLDLGDLAGGENWTVVRAISADGATVVGESWDENGLQPVRWNEAGGLQVLGALPGGSGGVALGVSSDGSVIVGQATSAGFPNGEAFCWTEAGSLVPLGAPIGADAGSAVGVSADGATIVGSFMQGFDAFAFRWTAGGGFERINNFAGADAGSGATSVSADGAIVGGYGSTPDVAPEIRAILWTAGTGAELGALAASGGNSTVNALSADAGVAVGWSVSDAGVEAFRWTVETGMQNLGTVPGGLFFSVANAVSADGNVVVGRANTEEGPQAFLWTEAAGMVVLADFLTAQGLDLAGWTLTEAMGISADGLVIAGNGTTPAGDTGAWLVNLRQPEPESPPEEEDPGEGGEENPPPPPPPGEDPDQCRKHGPRWPAAKWWKHGKDCERPHHACVRVREALKKLFAQADENRRRRRCAPVVRRPAPKRRFR